MTITANAVMGEVKVIVDAGTHVVVDGVPIMGEFHQAKDKIAGAARTRLARRPGQGHGPDGQRVGAAAASARHAEEDHRPLLLPLVEEVALRPSKLKAPSRLRREVHQGDGLGPHPRHPEPRLASRAPDTGWPSVGPLGEAAAPTCWSPSSATGPSQRSRYARRRVRAPGTRTETPRLCADSSSCTCATQRLDRPSARRPPRAAARPGRDDSGRTTRPECSSGRNRLNRSTQDGQLVEVVLGGLGQVPLDAEGAEQRGRGTEVQGAASGPWCASGARRRARRRTPARPAGWSSAGSAGGPAASVMSEVHTRCTRSSTPRSIRPPPEAQDSHATRGCAARSRSSRS